MGRNTNDKYTYTGNANVARTYDSNGLNQYTSTAYTVGAPPPGSYASICHDANGNLIADGLYVYLYDIENRLVEMRKRVEASCAQGLDITLAAMRGAPHGSAEARPLGQFGGRGRSRPPSQIYVRFAARRIATRKAILGAKPPSERCEIRLSAGVGRQLRDEDLMPPRCRLRASNFHSPHPWALRDFSPRERGKRASPSSPDTGTTSRLSFGLCRAGRWSAIVSPRP